MANVQVFQRNAHLAGAVKLEYVTGHEGRTAKGTLTAISNTVRGSGEAREQQPTAIQWTLWGAQAENAAEYLGRGSHVNIVGRLRNNNYVKNEETVYGWDFAVEEIDYLDSRAEAAARRGTAPGVDAVGSKGSSAHRPARADA